MSAVAQIPRRALAGAAVRVRVAPLVALVAVSAVVRTATAWMRPTPNYFPDEYMYAAFARSIAAGHLPPAVRGAPAHFAPLLQPLLTAPAWLLPTVADGYRATQAIESVVMSLAAVPVYLLARRLDLRPRAALAAAALSLLAPALVYSGFVLSEPFAYPLALAAVAAAVAAVDRPGARTFGVFLVLAALTMFTRMQFALLFPAFVLALAVVALRERRLAAFVREHRLPLGLLVAACTVLLAAGPARNTGYYPSFTNTPGFDAHSALRLVAPDALVLAFALGFVLVPGGALGLAYAIARPLRRAELAFGALTAILTVGLFAEAVVYGHPNYVQERFLGHTDYVQERYLFYLLPLWAIAFLLYARRGWPRRGVHAVLGVALVVLALRIPLSGNLVGDRYEHSPFLFALRRLAEAMGSVSGASLVVVVAAAAATAIVLAVAAAVPQAATGAALALAGVAMAAGSAGAVSFDIGATRALQASQLAGRPSLVDDTVSGPTTMVLLPGSAATDLTLFWNRSVDRLALLTGADPADSFVTEPASVGRDGTLSILGRPARGSLLLSTYATTVLLGNGTVRPSWPGTLLVHAAAPLRLRLELVGRFSDGWLAAVGTATVWPAGHPLRALVLPLRAPAGSAGVTVTFRVAGRRAIVRRVPAHGTADIAVPLCTDGPVQVTYAASPRRLVPGGRLVAARAGMPRVLSGRC